MKPLRQTFGGGDEDAAAWLYHGALRPVAGKILQPQPNETQAGERGNFVFATSHMLPAFAYALKTEDMLACGTVREDGQDCTLCVIAHRDKFLKEATGGRVYRLPKEAFRNVAGPDGRATDEWIAEVPVPVDEENAIPVPGIDAAMEKGVQIFFLKDGMSAKDFFEQTDGKPLSLRELAASPLYSWENRLTGNPRPLIRGL